MANIKIIAGIFTKLRAILNREQKKRSLLCFALIIISGFLEMLSIAVIIPFLNALLQAEELMQNDAVRQVMEMCGIETEKGLFVLLAGGVIVIFVLKDSLILLSNYYQIRFNAVLRKELSEEMFFAYLKKPYIYFLDVNVADVQNGVSYDVDNTCEMLSASFTLLLSFFKMFFICIFLLITDIFMAVALIAIAAVLIVLFMTYFKPKMERLGREQREANITQSKVTLQTISGIKEVMVMNRQDKFQMKYEQAQERRKRADLEAKLLDAIPVPALEIISIIGLMAILILRLYTMEDVNSFIVICAAFALGAIRILPCISGVINNVNSIILKISPLEAAYGNFKEVRNENQRAVLTNTEKPQALSMQHDLMLKGIIWKYPHSEKYVLQGLDLTIVKGESIAIIGASGAGKTTLANIILGLLRPESGTVELDGKDVLNLGADWSSVVGYVPQDVFLLDDSIRNNILFGLSSESDEKIWAAMEQAQLKEFVENLPEQLNTIVGERGVKFSGGQRQRLAIARALYYNPEILVLDEATSALDTETETAVMESIEALQGKKTMVIIAHRLDTVRHCDKIYEIVEGKAIGRKYEEVFRAE